MSIAYIEFMLKSLKDLKEIWFDAITNGIARNLKIKKFVEDLAAKSVFS